jgi:hypothetical protein
MAARGLSAAYINQITNELLAEIAAIPTGSQDPVRLKALWWAIDHLGDTNYGFAAGGGSWKCNIFVYDCYLYGADVGMPDRRNYPGEQPYGANVLGDLSKSLDCLTPTMNPRLGDIVAFISTAGSGHSGLKVGSGLLIYAGEHEVKLGTFGENFGPRTGHRKWGGRRHIGGTG